MGGSRLCIGSSFERCGWQADITAENKSKLLSVRLKDSWQGDLAPVHPSSEPESAAMCVLAPEGTAEPPAALQCGLLPSPTPPSPPHTPSRQASDDMSEDRSDEEDLELEDEKAQEQEYLARERRAEAAREAVGGVGWLRELASAAYDRVMDGEHEEEEAKEDESEEAQEANARRMARLMSACDSFERE